MEEYNLVKNTLDQIPQAEPNAKHIVGLVKEGGRITGYNCPMKPSFPNPKQFSWQSRDRSRAWASPTGEIRNI